MLASAEALHLIRSRDNKHVSRAGNIAISQEDAIRNLSRKLHDRLRHQIVIFCVSLNDNLFVGEIYHTFAVERISIKNYIIYRLYIYS